MACLVVVAGCRVDADHHAGAVGPDAEEVVERVAVRVAERTTARRARMPLVERLEPVRVDVAHVAQRRRRELRRPERLLELAAGAVLLVVAQRREVDDLPLWHLDLQLVGDLGEPVCDEAARDVVLVPPRHRDDAARPRLQSGHRDAREPCPLVVAELLAFDLLRVLHRVVDEEEPGDADARETTFPAGGPDGSSGRAIGVEDPPLVDRASRAVHLDPGAPRDPVEMPRFGARLLLVVRDEGVRQRRVVCLKMREPVQAGRRLPVPRRHRDHREDGPVPSPLQQVDQRVEVRRRRILRVYARDELTQRLDVELGGMERDPRGLVGVRPDLGGGGPHGG